MGITDKITVILDTDRGHHSRDDEEGLSESFETGIRAAASLGVRHLREGYEIKAEANGGPLSGRRPSSNLKIGSWRSVLASLASS